MFPVRFRVDTFPVTRSPSGLGWTHSLHISAVLHTLCFQVVIYDGLKDKIEETLKVVGPKVAAGQK